VKSANLKIMSDEEILMAKARVEDELGTDDTVDNDELDNSVALVVPQFGLDSCSPATLTVVDECLTRAPFTPQFGLVSRSPATPTVDDSLTRASFTPKAGLVSRSPATPTVVDDSLTRASPKSAYELACDAAMV
jgi:hypothetical protein